jgi:hypothetical protein
VNSPASKKLWTACPWGPKGQKLQLVVMGCMSATSGAYVMSPCHYKKRQTVTVCSSNSYQQHMASFLEPFPTDSSTTSSPWSFISPEIMDFDTVYVADLRVKAQRPLDTSKTHGKWENMMKTP